MSNPFSKPKKPKTVYMPAPQAPAPPPPPPTIADPEVETEAQKKLRKYNQGGRASTFLTEAGVDDPTSVVKFLGSAAKT